MIETKENIKGYKDLRVWQKSMDLVNEVYHATENFPKREWYGLANQMRRAAVSIPSNIAEGSVRSTKEFAQFLSISRGSLAELETQMTIARMRKYISKELYEKLSKQMNELSRMLMGLFRSIGNPKPYKAQSTKHEALS